MANEARKIWCAIVVAVTVFILSSTSANAQDRVWSVTSYDSYRPSACLEAASRTKTFHLRALPDTGRFDAAALGRPLPAVVKEVRACITRFSVENVAPRELPALVGLYDILDNDSAANAAADRWIEIESGFGDMRHVSAIALVVRIHLQSYRVGQSRAYLRRLDALGGASGVAIESVELHNSVSSVAQQLGMDSVMVIEADTTIAIAARMTNATAQWAPRTRDDQRIVFQVSDAYRRLAQAAFDQTNDPAAALAVLKRSGDQFGPSVQQYNEFLVRLYSLVNTRAPRVDAQFWFGLSGDSLRPAPGKVSLIVFGLRRSSMPALARLQQRFPVVDITVVQPTRGSFRGDGMLGPSEEAERLWRYASTDLNFSGALALMETKYDRIPDGRRNALSSPTETAYNAMGGGVTVIVDGNGMIRQILEMPKGEGELAIEKAMSRLLR